MNTCNLLESQVTRCAAMRAAKARKRMERAGAHDVVKVGRVVFEGTLFGGRHEMVLRHRAGEKCLMVQCDGVELRPRTGRGFVAMLGRAVWGRMRHRVIVE